MTAPAGDQQGTGQGGQGNAGGNAGSGGDGEAKFTQAQLNSYLAEERRKTEARFEGFDDIKSKADQFDQLTESTKSEIQRATDTAADIKAKYEASQADNGLLQTQLLRQQIAADKGLPAAMWKRVQGTTKEEITADVDDLLGSSTSTSSTSKTNSFRSGASSSDGKSAKERAASALRGLGTNR